MVLVFIVVVLVGVVGYFPVVKKSERTTKSSTPQLSLSLQTPITETPTPTAPTPRNASVEKVKVYRNEQHNFEFKYPDNFVIGKYKKEDPEPFPNSVVLVEKSLLGSIPAAEIPIGEISTITIQPHVAQEAKFYSGFNKPEYRVTIGQYEVARLPGFPGPYGDTAFYYVLVRSNNMVIDFTAHRTKFNAAANGAYSGSPSHYDQVIEGIISTLVFTK